MSIPPPQGQKGGNFTGAITNGKVLADDGNLYDTVQAAENSASDWIFIGVGTFSESVTVDTSGLDINGAGRGSLVDGGSSDAFVINAANVSIEDIAVQTTAGDGNNVDGISTDTNADTVTVRNVWVIDSDQHGVALTNGTDHSVSEVIVEASDDDGIRVSGDDSQVRDNRVLGTDSGHGINGSGNDQIITDNRVAGAGDDGINISGTDQILTENRVSGSANDDIDDSSATTPATSTNITGAAN